MIGNNIANVGTVGFKGSRTEFSDLISADAGGQIGKIGLGSRVGAVRTLFTQGAIESTGRSLDLSIEGQGFFVLRDEDGQVFTRAGNFQLQPDGTVTNLHRQGAPGHRRQRRSDAGGGLQDVTVAGLASQAKATTYGRPPRQPPVGRGAQGEAPSTRRPSRMRTRPATMRPRCTSSTRSARAHDVSIVLHATGTNAWDLNFGVDAGDDAAAPRRRPPVIRAPERSRLVQPTARSRPASGFGLSVTSAASRRRRRSCSTSALRRARWPGQFAGPSGISFDRQDGFGAGGVTSLNVDELGVLTATSSTTGRRGALPAVDSRTFAAPEGPEPAGQPDLPRLARLGPGRHRDRRHGRQRGSIVSSALEQSNVQIAQQFIELISTQRSFQANTTVITASDQLLGDLINIIR